MPSSGGDEVDSDSGAVTIDSSDDDDDERIESATIGAPNIEARAALPT